MDNLAVRLAPTNVNLGMLRKVIQFIETVSVRGGVKAVLTERPRSITSFRIVSRLQSEVGNLATIIDCGANVGQFARAVSTAYPRSKVISFEPLPDVATQLKKNLGDVPNHEVIQNALGSSSGSVDMRRASNNGQSSSILPFIGDSNGLLKGVSELGMVQVPLTSLDATLTGSELEGPILLKLDLQGYELEALRGAAKLLKHCDFVLVESALQKSYVGEPYFHELIEYLGTQRFFFTSILNVEENENGQYAQVDALFKRCDANDS